MGHPGFSGWLKRTVNSSGNSNSKGKSDGNGKGKSDGNGFS